MCIKKNTPLFFFIITLHICIMLSCAVAYSGEAIPDAGNALSKPQPSSIRQCLNAFMLGMLQYERHHSTGLETAFSSLQKPENHSDSSVHSKLLRRAKRLYLVLQNIDYDPLTIPVTVNEDIYLLKLGKVDDANDLSITLKMIHTKDNGWIISKDTLKDERIKSLYKDLSLRLKKFARNNTGGNAFVQNLISPYKTMLALCAGVTRESGYTIDDAVDTLYLNDDYSPVLMEYIGKIYAVQLYRILQFRSGLRLEQLSADPYTEKNPIFLIEPDVGVVTMNIYTNTENLKAWKFSEHSINIISSIYDDYMHEGMVKFINSDHSYLKAIDLPIHIIFDDFFQVYFPGLEKRLWGINIWKHLIGFISILCIPLILYALKIVFRILNNVRLIPPSVVERKLIQNLFTPVAIIIISYFILLSTMIVTTNHLILEIVINNLKILLTITTAWVAQKMIDILIAFAGEKLKDKDKLTAALVIGQILKLFILIAALMQLATIFDLDYKTTIATLGVGGIAFALAGKNSVENFFGTLMVIGTRPFAIGDSIIVAGISGTVEHIGMRSTTLTDYGIERVVPNSLFIANAIDNKKRRALRHTEFDLGITYDTPFETIKTFINGIKELVDNRASMSGNSNIVNLHNFGDSSIDIHVSVYISTRKRSVEYKEREGLLMSILELADDLKVNFAFPTHTVFTSQG